MMLRFHALGLLLLSVLSFSETITHTYPGATASSAYTESLNDAFGSSLKELLSQYSRRVTFLEIGRTVTPYALPVALTFKAISVALLVEGGAQEMVREVLDTDCHAVTVLAPTKISMTQVETLARCEHFDVVFVHDAAPLMTNTASRLVTALTNLGDYVFIEASSQEVQRELLKRNIPQVASSGGSILFLSCKPKVGLDIARFTQKYRSVAKVPRYRVISSFQEKWFSKKALDKPLPWVDGINLITFAMLKGVYPNDKMIRRQITKIKHTHSHHNDLVLGNIIMQGDRLIPIDVYDERRDADISKCVSAALAAFKEGNNRMVNPEKWIQRYYDMV